MLVASRFSDGSEVREAVLVSPIEDTPQMNVKPGGEYTDL